MTEQGPQMPGGEGRPPTEEELRAAYEAELQRIRVEDVLVQTIVSLLNLGGRRAGLAPGTEGERDLEQVRKAIEGARALIPLVEAELGPDAATLRDALSQLQLAYTQLSAAGAEAPSPAGPGGPGEDGPPPPPAEGEAGQPGDAGPAQRSGRLWVPGQ
ncbi:MAG: hypothetical protein QOF04_1630 [Solirubrobacteraceae bacterium]|jgi:hypothetical protein|nr:hypothetical protein [Solirubrobacteraceae bacterium]